MMFFLECVPELGCSVTLAFDCEARASRTAREITLKTKLFSGARGGGPVATRRPPC
jgi:hypothetical protein